MTKPECRHCSRSHQSTHLPFCASCWIRLPAGMRRNLIIGIHHGEDLEAAIVRADKWLTSNDRPAHPVNASHE